MEKRWVFKADADQAEVKALAQSLQVPEKIAALLVNRGINDFEQSKMFFRPDLKHLHDPMMMKDMDRAVTRLMEALTNQDKVLVYGDYDVDGTTSVAMMYTYLTQYLEHVEYYIPDRYKEGYGLSEQGVQYAIDQNFDLIITLDCGIKANEKVKKAKEDQVDVIICDHHLPGDEVPNCIVLDPQRPDCNYPYKKLSGCGVGFKLIQALEYERGGNAADIIDLLDFVSISVAADIVALTGENRILASYGLKQINRAKGRVGIDALIEVAKKDKPLNITEVVFAIAPRINAAGRLSDAKQAVAIMVEKDPTKAKRQADWIDENNMRRRDLDSDVTEKALAQIKEDEVYGEKATSVVFHPDWHKGIVGIVASRLIEQHYKPTIVLCENGEQAVGSARSVKGFDIYRALEACSDYMDQFGGHKYAAGMSIPLEKLDQFKAKFEEVVKESIHPDLLVPNEQIEMELSFSDILSPEEDGRSLPKFFRILQQMEPFGPENMKPVFVTRNVQDAGESKIIGKTEEHVRMHLKDDSGRELNGIAFGFAEKFEDLKTQPFDLAYTLEENKWRQKSYFQLNVKDIRFV